ncbi:MAG TPA: hypothetical protein VIV60_20630, partial [Polyangiaceae bacterium]
FYTAEEQVTRPWHGATAADQQDSLMMVNASMRGRRWRVALGSIGAIGLSCGLIGYLWPSLLTSSQSVAGSSTPPSERSGAEPPRDSLGPNPSGPGPTRIGALPRSNTDATDRVVADAALNNEGGGAATVASVAADGSGIGSVPWAKPDDGAPREGFPPIEDPYGGKGRLLADGYGYLIVRFPEAAFIFSNSIAMGATNWKIATPCGEKILRIGLGEKPTTWLSNEARVNIACRGTTHVLFDRLPDVAVPPGVKRPIAPGTAPVKKSASEANPKSPSTNGDESAAAPDREPAPPPTKERDDNGTEQQQ